MTVGKVLVHGIALVLFALAVILAFGGLYSEACYNILLVLMIDRVYGLFD